MSNPPSDADIRVTQGIFEALKKQKNNDEFQDVVVVAGSSEFKCQRAILAAVSGFFRGLFASGMKECLESRVNLSTVSEDVFSQILDSIYSGRSILTEENIFSIWPAVDVLDIGVLFEDCKHFFKNTLAEKNCIFYCFKTRFFNEECNREALNCIAVNFRTIRFSKSLLGLTFEEIKYLVSSEKLNTYCEDDVIEIILRWVESTPKLDDHSDNLPQEEGASLVALNDNVASCKTLLEDGKSVGETVCQDSEGSEKAEEVAVTRSDLLAELLECSRYLLISYSFLVQTLSCHPLVKGHAKSLALVDTISRYLADTGLQQEWCPLEAIHRDGANVKNVFLLYDRWCDASVVYSPGSHCYQMKDASMNLSLTHARVVYSSGADCYQMKDESMNLDFETAKRESRIFYVGANFLTIGSGNNLLLHTPVDGRWNKKTVVGVWENHNTVLIGESLYSFEEHTEDKPMLVDVYKMRLSDIINPHTYPCQWQEVRQLSVKGLHLKATTSIGNKVIVFFAGASEAGFTVEYYDVFRLKYSIIKNQLGSASDLVTFRRDNEAFALQTNGALWRISLCPSSDELEFTQECQLWADIHITLYGAFLYGTYLHILGDSRDDMSFVTNIALQGVFESIVFHNSKCNYAHAVLSKRMLQKK